MSDRRLYRAEDGTPPLSADQRAVFDAYFDRPGVICAPAGSGTGKTTTAVETVAEAVVRELHRRPDHNPFESILVTTFTKDAARQLKARIKRRLREHREVAPGDDPVVRRWDDVLRWLETASNVRTIDSFTQDLLREVALDAGVTPSFGVADGIRRSDLLDDAFEELRADPDLADPIVRLERRFPSDGDPGDAGDTRDADSWESMVADLHRRCRECCLPIEEARRQLLRAVTDIHAGREPEEFEDVLAVVDRLTDYDTEYLRPVDDPDAWVDYARETYRESRRVAGDFGVVLAAFDRHYDRMSRSRGVLSHTDITHVVREFLDGDGNGTDGNEDSNSNQNSNASATVGRRERFRESVAGRFRHVVVDEFQDTNYAQCRILAHLLDGANALVIGDTKQSIYEWRSAEPRLFSRLVDYAAGESRDAADNVLDADRVRSLRLTENFRSHPHLVWLANHLFSRLFEDSGRGGIGTFDVEYEPLSARRDETEPDRAHVHALRIGALDPAEDRESESETGGESEGETERVARIEREAERVAGTLRAVLDRGCLRVDRATRRPNSPVEDDRRDPVRAGDVAILFRTRRHVERYSRALDRHGVDNAVLGSRSLFREPEVEAVIDALAWLERPDDPAAVRRLVESPVAGLSAAGVRRMADHDHDLDRAVEGWDGSRADRRELRALVSLRDDLQGELAGSKADLVSELLVHSAFDAVALAGEDGLQRYANLRQFVAVIDGWEDDDYLSYAEFVRRLDRLGSGRVDDDTELAPVADVDSDHTVKLLTVHAAKGLEFPVVVLADTTHDERLRKACNESFVADRRHGVAVRPAAGAPEQPDEGVFPTFDGEWFHEGDPEYDFDRGLLWLSENRGVDGRIRHDHPFRAHVRDRRAEFWRLLYVAVTRAADHLVIPFPERTARGDDRWTTWAAGLAAHLDLGEESLDTADGIVPVGVDEIDPADPPDGVSVDLADALDPAGLDPPGRPDPTRDPNRRFRPRWLSATRVAPLLDSPERFQRVALRGLGAASPDHEEDYGIDLDSSLPEAPAGADPPGDLSPAAWGTAVHRTLAAINRSPDPARAAGADLETTVERAVDALDVDADLATDRLRSVVVPAYRETPVWEAVEDGVEAYPERSVVAPLSVVDDDLRGSFLRGRVDLLYRPPAGWAVADFKTGSPAPLDSARHAAYLAQLDAYAWLFRTVYGIAPDAHLVYLPAGETVAVDADPDRFAGHLAGIAGLYVDYGGVLRRTNAGAPSSREG